MPWGEKRTALDCSFGNLEIIQKPGSGTLIRSATAEGFFYGLGWVHGKQKAHTLLAHRALSQGRLSDFFKPTPGNLDLDRFIRALDLPGNLEQESATLEGANRSALQSYCQGLNLALSLGPYKKAPKWTMEDSLLLARTLGVWSWIEQGYSFHGFLKKMVRDGMSWEKLQELFPEAAEAPDLEAWVSAHPLVQLSDEALNWLSLAPRFRGLSAVALGKDLSSTRGSLLAFSMTMDVSRPGDPFVKALWESPEGLHGGYGIPGIPGFLVGWNPEVCWVGAPGFQDHWIQVLEPVKKSQAQRTGESEALETRQERYTLDPKHHSVETLVKSSRGTFLSYPPRDGINPVFDWAGHRAWGTLNLMMSLLWSRDAEKAAAGLQGRGSVILDWILTDQRGHLARCQSGAQFDLPPAQGTYLPLAPQASPVQLKPASESPWEIAPPSGRFFLPWAAAPGPAYQAERLKQLVTPSTRFSPRDLEVILTDRYSIQAQKILAELRFTLPEDYLGNTLRSWDWTYQGQSASYLFEELHLDVIQSLFGKNFSSLEIWQELQHRSPLFHQLLPRLDSCLFNPTSQWFQGQTKSKALTMAVKETSARAEKETAPLTIPLHKPVWKEKKLPKPQDSGLVITEGRYCLDCSHLETLGGRTSAFIPRLKGILDPGNRRVWWNILDGDAAPGAGQVRALQRHLKGFYKEEEM